MKNSTKNTGGSLLIFAASIGFVIFALNNVPQDEHAPIQKEEPEPTEYEYTPTWYKFSDGSWSTLSHHPKTKERGVQINEKELETLKLAE